jgi:hypothetical protein
VGIVGNIHWFAWVCGPLTLVAAGLSTARTVYGWDKTIELSNHVIDAYGKFSLRYQFLVEDMNAQQTWTEDFEKRANSLREDRLKVDTSSYPQLSAQQTLSIQHAIKGRIKRDDWWLPKE